MRAQRLEGIQMLRGVAAMLVVYNHAAWLLLESGSGGGAAMLAPAPALAALGAIGVDLFFVISGFVMAMAAVRFADRRGAGRFLVERWIRIAPLFYLYNIVVATDLAIARAWPEPRSLLNSLIFVPLLDGGEYHWPLHYLGWTLSFEWVFYLIVAALIPLGTRWRSPVLLALLSALPLAGLRFEGPTILVDMLTNPMLWEFGAGVAAYGAWRSGWLRWTPQGSRYLAAAGIAMLATYTWALWPHYFDAAETIDGSTSASRAIFWGTPALLVFLAMFGARASGPFTRLWLLLGNASYSIYLSHLIVLRVMREVLERSGIRVDTDLLLVGLWVGCAIVGVAAWRLIEEPLLRLTRRMLLGDAPGEAARPIPGAIRSGS